MTDNKFTLINLNIEQDVPLRMLQDALMRTIQSNSEGLSSYHIIGTLEIVKARWMELIISNQKYWEEYDD